MSRLNAGSLIAGRNSRLTRTLSDLLTLVAQQGHAILGHKPSPSNQTTGLVPMCQELVSHSGDSSSLLLAAKLVDRLTRLNAAGLSRLLEDLATKFEAPRARVEAAIRAWEKSRDQNSQLELWEAAESPRQELFRRLNMVPGGTAAVVRLRGHLLEVLPNRPELRALETDLKHLFRSWFNPGFLRLEQIGWQSSAHTLQQLIEYDAVHQIQGWDDLRLRLAADRRCFGFFHPALPREPLIFVEIALTHGLPAEIGPLIDPGRAISDPATADTAVFYSINNCQPGLRGITFGNFLINQVVDQLSAELPQLKTFATLSPVPGFRQALTDMRAGSGLAEEEIRSHFGADAAEVRRLAGMAEDLDALLVLIDANPPRPRVVSRVLGQLALAYLLDVRRGRNVADPVAHFHLSNGARLERINPDADSSSNGQMFNGVMVNYVYAREELAANRARYLQFGRVALSRDLAARAKRIERPNDPHPKKPATIGSMGRR